MPHEIYSLANMTLLSKVNVRNPQRPGPYSVLKVVTDNETIDNYITTIINSQEPDVFSKLRSTISLNKMASSSNDENLTPEKRRARSSGSEIDDDDTLKRVHGDLSSNVSGKKLKFVIKKEKED